MTLRNDMTEPLLVQRGHRVVRIVLNRPDSGNALNQELADAFAREVALIVADTDSHIVVIQSTGPVFCAGGDVTAVATADDPGVYLTRLAATMHDALVALRDSPHVVVARVHAAAAGAGLALVLNADLVVASARAVFLSAYVGVGLTPDCGVSRLLPQVIGPRRAAELAITNRVLTADEALSWGLINEVAEPDALDARVDQLVAQLAEGPASAHSRTLALMRSTDSTYAEHLADEVDGLAAQIALDDTRARMAAFLSRSERKKATS
jgi:2-(1,2-epoxy-1,2-dihydrophenyl)acetyl-CoA isomerase